MHKNNCVLTSLVLFLLLFNLVTAQEKIEKIGLKKAINIVLTNNPELNLIKKEVEALHAKKIQAGLYENPEFEFSAENILGTEDFSGFKGSEISAQINQTIITAGKLNKKEQTVDKEITVVKNNYEIAKANLISKVKNSFYKAASIMSLLNMNEKLLSISEEFINNLQKRVVAGNLSPAEVSRANLLAIQIKMELKKLRTGYYNSVTELKSLMNLKTSSEIKLDLSRLPELNIIPKEKLLEMLDESPYMKQLKLEKEVFAAQTELEEALSVPDVTVSFGYKRLNEVKANTFILGASIPIPIFNKNQGAIEESKIKVDQKDLEYSSLKLKMKSNLLSIYNQLLSIDSILKEIESESLPEAEKAFEIIQEGNLAGRFAMIDVLDAQKSLYEIQNQYLSLLTERKLKIIELEKIIGREIE